MTGTATSITLTKEEAEHALDGLECIHNEFGYQCKSEEYRHTHDNWRALNATRNRLAKFIGLREETWL